MSSDRRLNCHLTDACIIMFRRFVAHENAAFDRTLATDEHDAKDLNEMMKGSRQTKVNCLLPTGWLPQMSSDRRLQFHFS